MSRRGKKTEAPERVPVEIRFADPETGLTREEAELRRQRGWANLTPRDSTRTTAEIIRGNLLTYFNLIFLLLAGAVAAVMDWKHPDWLDMSFLLVVLINALIGIVQELRSKKSLDRLTILSAPQGTVIREGKRKNVGVGDVVRDDIAVFSAGNQIFADAEVLTGEVQVNESLITGEADEIRKRPGDTLLSGSFVIGGSCNARIVRVGQDSFVSGLTAAAKKAKKSREPEMMRSLSALIKWIGLIVIPFGALMVMKEIIWLRRDVSTGVRSTVAAITGMIPEGLYLLTSVALAAGALRLSKKRTLMHELGSIETLARADVLCVDKTGTITENKMVVEDVISLCGDRYTPDDIRLIMSDYVYAMQNDNDTMAAMKRYFTGAVQQRARDAMAFTSVKKYGGVSFHEDETYLLGAPEILLGKEYPKYRDEVDRYSSRGCRVLLLCNYDGDLRDEKLTADMLPIGLILLTNKIRAEAPDTFRYFAREGVRVKVISGDNPLTVSEVARRAGIPEAEKAVDARMLETDKEIYKAAREYNVFGRVTPEQKRRIVVALKKQGHTVAMTGDGVNDVLALKSADCSIAVASGSDIARDVSDVVLMDSDFANLPGVVAEGRRVINNIERSASLYLVKNIFTFVLALVTVFFTLPYPFTPAQLSLVNCFTIGVPAFILAMEPNESRIEGKFLRNVIWKALPAALTDVILIIGVILFYLAFGLEESALSAICTAVMGAVGLVMVHRTCQPYTKLRKWMLGVMIFGFSFSFIFLGRWFSLGAMEFKDILVLVVLVGLAWPVQDMLGKWLGKLKNFFSTRRKKTAKA